jgi:sugar/nucleoside kinase (ribokinase family)
MELKWTIWGKLPKELPIMRGLNIILNNIKEFFILY